MSSNERCSFRVVEGQGWLCCLLRERALAIMCCSTNDTLSSPCVKTASSGSSASEDCPAEGRGSSREFLDNGEYPRSLSYSWCKFATTFGCSSAFGLPLSPCLGRTTVARCTSSR